STVTKPLTTTGAIRMATYFERLVTEATLQAADACGSISEALAQTGHQPLATIARNPQIIAAINRAREIPPKDRWRELCSPAGFSPDWPLRTEAENRAASAILAQLPGYCCLNDAMNLAARL